MSENNKTAKLFTDVFCELGDRLGKASGLCGCVLEKISANKNNKSIVVFMKSDRFVDISEISKAEEAMKETYCLSAVELMVNLTKTLEEEEFFLKLPEQPIKYLYEKFPSARGVLRDAYTQYEAGILTIHLSRKGSHLLKARGCDKKLAEYLQRIIGKKIKIKIKDGERAESFSREVILNNMATELLSSGDSSDKTPNKQNNSEVREVRSNAAENAVKKVKYKRRSIIGKDGPKKTASGKTIILGKDFEAEYIQIRNVNYDTGTCAVKGEIINVEIRKINGGSILVAFDVTDRTGAVQVKFFADEGDEPFVRDMIKAGKWVRLYGDAQYDKFTREVSIRANSIIEFDNKIKEDNEPEKRVELHLHTQMSSMDGVTSAEKLIERAAKWGHKAIAITDHGVVQAYPDAFKAGNKHKIKIIYGVECYLLDDTQAENPADFDWKKAPYYHAVILVKNKTGLKNLYKLISESHLNYFYKRPRVPKKLFDKYREGLILGSACESGEVYRAALKNDPELIRIASYYDYLEIQPLGNNDFLVRSGEVKNYDVLKEINKKITQLADTLGKPCVATCDVHFMDPEDEIFRRILMAGQGYSDADNQAPLYFRTTGEMLQEFKYLGEEKAYEVVVTNTNLIADMIEEIAPVPAGTFTPKIEGAEEDIRRMSMEKAKSIYGEELPEIVKERLEKELNSIINNGFAVMYMIAQKLVSKSLSDGYLVGSRGSVGSSFVANMAGITEVNSLPAHYICTNCKYSEFFTDGSYDCGFDLPDKDCPNCGKPLKKDGYDIPFETFLGFDGDKAPDIDLNFSGEYQPVAHKYTEVLFGEGHVFRAGTIGTIAEKTAAGFVEKYFESKQIPLSTAMKNWLTLGCTGVKRTTGQHPGGIMIVPKENEIYEFTPIQRPADDVNSDITTTHFDYHFLHDSILKLDILGHDDPTVIRMLMDITGIDARNIPIGEEKTMSIFRTTEALGVTEADIFSSVGTLGIPEFGTSFVRQMLVDTMPKSFSDLIRISGLSHGTDVWLNNAQDLIKSGICTLSESICCRDDIMIYLIHKGLPPKTAFKIMEDVRKGKGLKDEYVEIMKENGVPDWYIDSCNKIKYMFPKAHAAAYVMMAFRIAWFKVYYPEAFYASFFSVRGDDFDIEFCGQGRDKVLQKMEELKNCGRKLSDKEDSLYKILEVANEMYARGIKFLEIDLYKSHPTKFIVEPEGLRPPFTAIQGLGISAAEKIAEERAKGEFVSVDDLKNRTKVSKTIIEKMKNYGVLKSLPDSSQLTFFDI